MVQAVGKCDPVPSDLAFVFARRRSCRSKVSIVWITWVERFKTTQDRFELFERPSTIRQLVPVLPEREDCVEALFECCGSILLGCSLGVLDESGKIMNHPAGERVGRGIEFQLTDELLAERENCVRSFGLGRRT